MGREKREFKEWVLTRLRGQEVTVTDWEVIVGFNDESSIGGFSQRGLVGERVGKSHRRSLRRGRKRNRDNNNIMIVDMYWVFPVLHAKQCS